MRCFLEREKWRIIVVLPLYMFATHSSVPIDGLNTGQGSPDIFSPVFSIDWTGQRLFTEINISQNIFCAEYFLCSVGKGKCPTSRLFCQLCQVLFARFLRFNFRNGLLVSLRFMWLWCTEVSTQRWSGCLWWPQRAPSCMITCMSARTHSHTQTHTRACSRLHHRRWWRNTLDTE